jgi:hypothetical protein
LRYLIGLTHEGYLAVQRSVLSRPFAKTYLPHLTPRGVEALSKVKSHLGKMQLLAGLRNAYSFHFPDHAQLDEAYGKLPVDINVAMYSGEHRHSSLYEMSLYGKNGNYSSRGDGTYEDFLRRTINHKVNENEGAGVELTFRQPRNGVEHQYRARRSWHVVGGKVRESFDVLRDGVPDQLLSEHWSEYVEEILPARIAPLFFFDGEKVVELADAKQAPALLRVAIQSLLGLDIAQQLRVDLGVLSRRKRAELASDDERALLEKAQRELDDLEAQNEKAFQQQAACNGELAQAQTRLEEAHRAF